MSDSPYTFGQAREKVREATRRQEAAEQFRVDVTKDWAEKERAYRIALARRIVEVHAEGAAWTVAPDLARGDRAVADLRYARDVAAGVKDAAESAMWRHTADRRDLGRMVDWSCRRELAEDPPQPRWSGRQAA